MGMIQGRCPGAQRSVPVSTKPMSGSARSSRTRAFSAVAACLGRHEQLAALLRVEDEVHPPLLLHRRVLVDERRPAVAVDGDDDGQADGGLAGREGDDEQGDGARPGRRAPA